MSKVGSRPDISEQLREFNDFVNGNVTLADVAESAKKAAEGTDEDDPQGGGAKKTGKTASTKGVSAGAERAAAKRVNRAANKKPLETTAADQETAGRRALPLMGREVSKSALPVGEPAVKPEAAVTVASLDPASKFRKV